MSEGTYISKEGLEKLKEELQTRKMVTRREIAERLSTAKELGDLSENFEYHEAKDAQGHNEVRIINLGNLIRSAVIVEKKSGGLIGLGSTFVVETNGEQKTMQMVGAQESNPMESKISNESPLGKAFLGKKGGENVEVEVPSGTVSYKIIEIK